LRREQPSALGDDERATLLALADDLPQLWNHPAASIEIRKRILRAVLKEIIVTIEANRLLGATAWPNMPNLRASNAFGLSAQAIKKWVFVDSCG